MALTLQQLRGARDACVLLGKACIHAYSQILFSRAKIVGLLLIAATAFDTRLLLSGLAGALLAALVALLLRYDPDQIRDGMFGYNALLVALACAASFASGRQSVVLIVVAIVGSVAVTAALQSALGVNFNVPPLSLPFVFVFHLIIGAAPLLGATHQPLTQQSFLSLSLPVPIEQYLRALGAIFFLPRSDAGLFVALALLVHSRIGVLLSWVGFGVAQLLGMHLVGLDNSALAIVLGFNFILTAVALGGVWFVPSTSSFLLAGFGALLCGLIAVGLLPILGVISVPLLILPFNITVMLLLYAMRQRVKDGKPKAVDFLLGSPEENLNYFRTRMARFGAAYLVRFSAPFRGTWTCTQGVDGPHTHQGPWRYGLDFEVAGADGNLYRGAGRTTGDYHCYRLPVLAPADGTVVRVVDSVPDNAIGQINRDKNWGNLVITYHAPQVYSLVAHLVPGSIKVQEGQIVRRGDILGLCGNSGRSPQPHLHFQIQATARIGAPTTPVELHDVIVDRDTAPALVATTVPLEGGSLRNIDAQEEIAALFYFAPDHPLRFCIDYRGRNIHEEVVPEIDLQGNFLLRSNRNARLYYDRHDALFTVYDVLGPRSSVLHVIQATLPRVPFENAIRISWTDHLPTSRFSIWPLRWLQDLVAPFYSRRGIEMTYTMRNEQNDLIIEGQSKRHKGDAPAITTYAQLNRENGITRVRLVAFGKTIVATNAAVETKENKNDKTDLSSPKETGHAST